MPNLRLVTDDWVTDDWVTDDWVTDEDVVDDRPRVSLRLLMAASGRCSCDDCLWAYRRGNKDAGIVRVGCSSTLLTAVR
jgi:hypothetical protein